MATINSINSTINSTTAGIALSNSTGVLSSAATTNHAIQLGNASGTLSSLGVGSSNTALLGNTGADASFGTIATTAMANSVIGFNQDISNAGTSVINYSGAANATISLGSSLSIDIRGSGTGWRVATGQITQQSNWGWINSKSTTTVSSFTLPVTANVGDVMSFIWGVTSASGGQIRIAQNAGQQIFFNSSSTTVGTTGHMDVALASTGGAATLVCYVANTSWWVSDVIGTWTLT